MKFYIISIFKYGIVGYQLSMSLTYEIKSSGPRNLSCGTPDIISLALLLNRAANSKELDHFAELELELA